MKLHQLIALLPTVKSNTTKARAEIQQLIQKSALFKGLSRTYRPREEEGYVYPPESQAVQIKANDLIERYRVAGAELLNLTAQQEWSNTQARGSITIDGEVILADVPVSYLLFLEKQLHEIKGFIQSLPVLEMDQEWMYDANRSVFRTPARETAKTKKVMKPVVLYEATKEHPAQVKEATEDVVEGTWSLINFSGALPQDQINALLRRVDKLSKAVIVAREEANAREVERREISDPLFDYLFPPSILESRAQA